MSSQQCPPPGSLFYTVVNKEVEQQFSGTFVTEENCDNYSLNVNNLGKAAVLHFPFLLPSAAGAVPTQSANY
jgi:hypothetical protein